MKHECHHDGKELNGMIMGWEQEFEAVCKCGGEESTSAFKVTLEVEGPTRDFMTDVDPIWNEIEGLAGTKLHERGMRSTAEGLALHIADLVNRQLEGMQDTLKSVRVVQDGVFWVEV